MVADQAPLCQLQSTKNVQESIVGEGLPGALLCSARGVPDAFTQPAKLSLLQCLMLAFIAIASLATCSTESVQRLIILLAPLLILCN